MNPQLEVPQTETTTTTDVLHEILQDSAWDPDLYTERWQVPLGGE